MEIRKLDDSAMKIQLVYSFSGIGKQLVLMFEGLIYQKLLIVTNEI